MRSIDQYYSLTLQQLQELHKELGHAIDCMTTAKEKDPDARYSPTPVLIRSGEKLLRAQGLYSRFNALLDLGIADVRGSYSDHRETVSFTRLPGAEDPFAVPVGTEPL